jgi:hypothetical protein
MRFEVEKSASGHHWRLVVTAADLEQGHERLDRRLRVVGGDVRAKLDYHGVAPGCSRPAAASPTATN